MKPKQIILIIAVLIFVSSCNKEIPWFNKTKVEGIVTVKQTGQPLENVTIDINYVTNTSYNNYNIETIAKIITDEDGYFSYKFETTGDYYHYIYVYKNCYSFDFTTIEIKKEKKMSIIYYVMLLLISFSI
ncbi:MAG: hypothetical protein U9Q83_05960 [Bacteroidota bacterium]|nr:hypothetical protein [Bacteroidota bacterium]